MAGGAVGALGHRAPGTLASWALQGLGFDSEAPGVTADAEDRIEAGQGCQVLSGCQGKGLGSGRTPGDHPAPSLPPRR